LHGIRIDAFWGLLERMMVDRKMTAGCRAGSGAARRRPSRHGRTFSKISIIAGFGCFLGVFAGFRNQDRIRTRSGRDQDRIRTRSGLAQDRVRNSPFGGLFSRNAPPAEREIEARNHFIFCTLLFLSVAYCSLAMDDPAPPCRARRRRGLARTLVIC